MKKTIDIPYIAKLARLHIRDDELDGLRQDMQSLLGMVDTLPAVSETTALPDDGPTQLREDIPVMGVYTADHLLQNAPETQSGCIVVPRTLE